MKTVRDCIEIRHLSVAPEKFMRELQDKIEEAKKKGTNVRMDITSVGDPYSDSGHEYGIIEIAYDRPQNDKERADDERNARLREDANRRLYESLKKQFEK